MIIKKRTVVELAAGLGLPSLMAAHYSRAVFMSDYLPEAIELMQQTIDHNRIGNLQCGLLDLNNVPPSVKAEVLLLSDVNYDPRIFDQVFEVIARFISEGSTVILSTPQRLMAKPFIERLLSFQHRQEEIVIKRNDSSIAITVLIFGGEGADR